MKKGTLSQIFEFLFLVIYSSISIYYFIQEDYWFALILIIPVVALVINLVRRDETSEKVEDAKK